MKIFLVLLALCLMGATYEKVSDTVMKKTEVNEVVTTDNLTLNTLKTRKANLEQQKTDYNIAIDARIAEVDAEIAEAANLGIKEITEIGNIQ